MSKTNVQKKKFGALFFVVLLATFVLAGSASASYLLSTQQADDDISVALAKTTKWTTEGDYSKAQVELLAEAQGIGTEKTPRVLFVGTMCSAHTLTADKLIKAINAVSANAECDVDYLLYNGQDRSTSVGVEDITGSLKAGESLSNAIQNKIKGQFVSGNHKSLNKFLDGIYEKTAVENIEYDAIVLEFDRSILAHSYGVEYVGKEMPKSEHEAAVADIMKDFYENNKVIWILKPNEVPVGTTVPPEETPYKVTPEFYRYNDTTHSTNWQELDYDDTKENFYPQRRQYNAFKALVAPSAYNTSDDYSQDTRDKVKGVDAQTNYDATAEQIAQFVTESIQQVFSYKLTFNDKIQIPQGCVYDAENTHFEISEDGITWEDVRDFPETYNWNIDYNPDKGEVTGTFSDLVYKKYVKLIVAFSTKNTTTGKSFLIFSPTGNPNNGEGKVQMESADGQKKDDTDDISKDEVLQWPIKINYQVEDQAKGYCTVSNQSESPNLMTDTPDSEIIGSIAQPGENWQFVNWTNEAWDPVGTKETFMPSKNVHGRNFEQTYTAHFVYVGEIEKSVDKTEAEPGDLLTYTITVTNDTNADIENWKVTDTLPLDSEAAHFVEVTPQDGGVLSNNVITWQGSATNKLPANSTKTLHFTGLTRSDSTADLTYKNKATLKITEAPSVTSNEVVTVVKKATRDLVISKNWSDSQQYHNGTSEALPQGEYVKVALYQDGQLYQKYTLNEQTKYGQIQWAMQVKDLPIYNAQTGAECVYTICELTQDQSEQKVVDTYSHHLLNGNVADYTPTYSYTESSATVTNTYNSKPDDFLLTKTGQSTAKPGETLTYNLSVEYLPEHGSATDVIVEDMLPEKLIFVSASEDGIYDASTHTVYWIFDKIDKTTPKNFELVCQVPADVLEGTFENCASIIAYGNAPDEFSVKKEDLFPEDPGIVACDIRKSILRYDEKHDEVDYLFTNEEIGGYATLRYYCFKFEADELTNPVITDVLPVGLIPPKSGETDEYILTSTYDEEHDQWTVVLELKDPLTKDVTPINLEVQIDPDITETLSMISDSTLDAVYTDSSGKTVDLDATSNETEMLVTVPTPVPDPQPTPPVVTDVKEITAFKTWSDGAEIHSADEVTISLYADDVKIDSQILSSTNNWQFTWEELKIKTEAGNIIAYTITEDSVFENYQSSVAVDSQGNFQIVNQKIDEPVPVPPDPIIPIEEVTSTSQTGDNTIWVIFACFALVSLIVLIKQKGRR